MAIGLRKLLVRDVGGAEEPLSGASGTDQGMLLSGVE